MAKEMGEGLGRSSILLDPMSARVMTDVLSGLALRDEHIAFTPSFDMRPQTVDDWSVPILAAAQRIGVRTYPPIGPVRARLDRAEPKLTEAGGVLHRVRHNYDSIAWPYANAGFFKLRKKIPTILANLNFLR